jgi:hypothetical protein
MPLMHAEAALPEKAEATWLSLLRKTSFLFNKLLDNMA